MPRTGGGLERRRYVQEIEVEGNGLLCKLGHRKRELVSVGRVFWVLTTLEVSPEEEHEWVSEREPYLIGRNPICGLIIHMPTRRLTPSGTV